ncbi:hypothetical protein K488DRAFT_83044 [Vararia minispora EC-137]|uniref:Uncharacterized protein n=1 Tax=Vararia minispora EC-137 TaxID=1314806 RepID=A0ACB8QVB2_9AGAM|nr:hypothetical protein K488DRAFT_83044 [Vararia minispora EC-137]
MSALISSDAPLTSPISDCSWDQQPFYSPTGMDTFSFDEPPYSQHSSPSPPYSDSSASSVPAESALKMRLTPDYSSDASDSQLCLPTSQVFDLPPPAPPSSPVAIRVPAKRPSSPSPSETSSASAPKKVRSGDRPSTKDFVPPDVTGLSKREARLVKNRAAAFLSRQRKREEFESMEIRVAELEKENARLQVLAQGGPSNNDEQHMLSEIDHLRAQLAEATERERKLSSQLSRRSPTVKVETPDIRVPASPARSAAGPLSQSLQLPGRSSASLSLLVSIVSIPVASAIVPAVRPSNKRITISPPSFAPITAPADLMSFTRTGPTLRTAVHLYDSFDWRMPASAAMDLDRPASHQQNPRRLEFVEDTGALGLGGLDISFDAQPSADGKIRVRIHHPSASPSSSPSLSASSYPTPASPTFARPFSLEDPSSWGMHLPAAHPQPFVSSNGFEMDPFFGVGGGVHDMSFGMDPSVLLGQPAERHIDTAAGRRRVRIALKSLPLSGADGGEWEVELC